MHPYAVTIQAVKKVNRQAALIMTKKLPLLKQRGLMPNSAGPGKNQPNPGLCSAFYWSDTPQGHDYWADINQKLRHLLLSGE